MKLMATHVPQTMFSVSSVLIKHLARTPPEISTLALVMTVMTPVGAKTLIVYCCETATMRPK